MKEEKINKVECERKCPIHGELSVRGRYFKGAVKKIVNGQRAVVEWQRIVYYPKFERYAKTRSKVHAHIPKCLRNGIKEGDYVKIGECRPLSKIIHFVVLSKESIKNN
ncbi:MAG: 30S ribosomal protein S17 [Candidatus Pacearchaeota archaeon]